MVFEKWVLDGWRVGRLLVEGVAKARIAERIGISRTTVINAAGDVVSVATELPICPPVTQARSSNQNRNRLI